MASSSLPQPGRRSPVARGDLTAVRPPSPILSRGGGGSGGASREYRRWWPDSGKVAPNDRGASPRLAGQDAESAGHRRPSNLIRVIPASVSYTHLRAHETRHDLV